MDKFDQGNSTTRSGLSYLCTMSEKIIEIIRQSVAVKQQILQDASFIERIEKGVYTITQAFRQGHKLWLCGNGGSAADAQHLAAEFSGRFYINRHPLPAEALHVNTSYLTAVANDYSYEVVYARLLQAMGSKGDVLIGLTTSGNSPNVIKAFEKARQMGITTIAFTGAGGGAIKDLSDILFNVPSTDTPRIQESHILIGHIICQLVEEQYFKQPTH